MSLGDKLKNVGYKAMDFAARHPIMTAYALNLATIVPLYFADKQGFFDRAWDYIFSSDSSSGSGSGDGGYSDSGTNDVIVQGDADMVDLEHVDWCELYDCHEVELEE